MANQTDNSVYPDLNRERLWNSNINNQCLYTTGSCQRVSTPGAIKLYNFNRRDRKPMTAILPSFEYPSYLSNDIPMPSPVPKIDEAMERNQNIKLKNMEYYGDDYKYYENLAKGVMNMQTAPTADDVNENYYDFNCVENEVQHIIDYDESTMNSQSFNRSISALGGQLQPEDAESYLEDDDMDYRMDPNQIYLNPIEGCSTILENRKRNNSQPLEGNHKIQSHSVYHVSSPHSPGSIYGCFDGRGRSHSIIFDGREALPENYRSQALQSSISDEKGIENIQAKGGNNHIHIHQPLDSSQL